MNHDTILRDPTYILKSLREFGLNPDDWAIHDFQDEKIKIFNIEEPSITLTGKFGPTKWRWLEFSSLDI